MVTLTNFTIRRLEVFWVLDALQKIKAENDSTLSYRRSCREGICGSCAMNIDGANSVACLKPVDADTSTATTITPLPRMFVIKDLVVDLTHFYQRYKYLARLIEPKRPPEDGREYKQSPADRKKLDGRYELMYTLCLLFYLMPFLLLGPAALLHAYRWIVDSRDEFTEERLEALTEAEKRSRSPSGPVSDFPIVALLALTVSIDRQVIKKSKLGNISPSGDAGALIRLRSQEPISLRSLFEALFLSASPPRNLQSSPELAPILGNFPIVALLTPP
ncbi:hypothetical protein ACLB2K_006334 [Fragaria x ananassa]